MNHRPAVFLLAFAALLTACGTLNSRPPRHLDLSGQWHLDESLSDDPTAVMREHHAQGGGAGMHRRGGGMSWPSTTAGSSNSGGYAAHGPRHGGGGWQGGAADRSSGWKGQAFIVRFDVQDGPKATRSYELNDGGTQLVVITQVSGGRGGTWKLRTVYERDPGLKS